MITSELIFTETTQRVILHGLHLIASAIEPTVTGGVHYRNSKKFLRSFFALRLKGWIVTPSPKFRLAHDTYRSSCIVGPACVIFCWLTVQPELYVPDRRTGEEMVGLRKPRRRWWGWLVAVAYLLASMTPSLAIAVPLDVSAQCEHEAEEHAVIHEHDHADAVHSHDVARAGDCDDDQDQHHDRHAACCGSVLCFSAVSPQAPLIGEIVAPRSRCETRPDVIGDEGAFRRHYRPPIA